MSAVKGGHRERLRQRFMGGEASSRTDESLLELLLTFGIPQRDVQPLARTLLAQFGSLEGVLAAEPDVLCNFDGVKCTTATLLKLAHYLRTRAAGRAPKEKLEERSTPQEAQVLPGLEPLPVAVTQARRRKPLQPRKGTSLFGKALLREAIEILPALPSCESLDDVREFLRANLHFSAEATRKRNAAYITRRLFPDGVVDGALCAFAKAAATPALKEVCFYRFCKAEPLMQGVACDLLAPALGLGKVRRERFLTYLTGKYRASKSASDSSQAIVEALVAGGIAEADRRQITFSARPVRPSSFAFILHSEFPEPGIYDIADAEANRLLGCLLWTPEGILSALYELRNLGLIAKVSEIDSVRQFTLKFDLMGAVNQMLKKGKVA